MLNERRAPIARAGSHGEKILILSEMASSELGK